MKVAKLVGLIPKIVDYLSGEDVVLEPVKRNPQLKYDYDATHKLSRRLVNYFLSFKIHVTHSETVCISVYTGLTDCNVKQPFMNRMMRQPPIQGLIMIAIAEFDSSSGSNIKTVNNS